MTQERNDTEKRTCEQNGVLAILRLVLFTGCRGHPCPGRCGTHGGFRIQSNECRPSTLRINVSAWRGRNFAMPQLILAIDQGTTGTTVFVVDARGRIRGRAYAEIRQFYPKPGWVEHDPEEIYRSVITLSKKAIAAAKVSASAIAAIGITNQRETFVVWELRSGRPVYRAIVWQCRRSAAICDALRDRESDVADRTGLSVDPHFSCTKCKC